jgi:hypothetical protein
MDNELQEMMDPVKTVAADSAFNSFVSFFIISIMFMVISLTAGYMMNAVSRVVVQTQKQQTDQGKFSKNFTHVIFNRDGTVSVKGTGLTVKEDGFDVLISKLGKLNPNGVTCVIEKQVPYYVIHDFCSKIKEKGYNWPIVSEIQQGGE